MRKLITNYWSQIITFCVVVLGLYLFTFYLYPSLIHGYLIKNVEGYNISNDLLGRGTYGDMYGALNTFFSGLAFIGLIVTIGVQIYLHEEEKRVDREKEEKKQSDFVHNKLFYFTELVKALLIENVQFANSLEQWIDKNQNGRIGISTFQYDSSESIYILLNKKINQEEIFEAYQTKFKDDEAIKMLLDIDTIHNIRINFFKIYFESKKEHDIQYETLRKISDELIIKIAELKSRQIANNCDILLSKESLSDIDEQNTIFRDFLTTESVFFHKFPALVKEQYYNKIQLFENIGTNRANLMKNFSQYPLKLRDINHKIEKTNTKISNSLSFQS